MDKETAKFIKKGNIFEDGMTENTSALVTKTGPKEHTYSIFSLDALQTELSGGPETYESRLPIVITKRYVSIIGCREVAGVAKMLLKAEFKFSKCNGAALLMYEPTTSILEGYDHLLSAAQYEHLRDMNLVTEVVTCSAYALYLAGSSQLTLSFLPCCILMTFS